MGIKDLFIYNGAEIKEDFALSPPEGDRGVSCRDRGISPVLSENLEFIKGFYSAENNFDFVIREFKIKCRGGEKQGFLIFYDGLTNQELLNRDVLHSLMQGDIDLSPEEVGEKEVSQRIITQAPLSTLYKMEQVIEAVGFGNCGIFIDGCACSFVADIKGFGARSVGQPVTEAVLSGPQEAFVETVMPNIGLIRKIVKDPNLICQKINIGSKSKTPCAVMHIKGITNKSLLDEAIRRLEGIDIEYLFSSTQVEMLIEDSTLFPLPQILKTERPDRAASMLTEGKVAVLVQGSPFALILPATAADLIEASEDNYVRAEEANFMRIVRLFGIFLSLFLPGTFVAVAMYHHESIPTDLLFAIEATREIVPFSLIGELLLMELAFELIKEASIRIPSPIGSTLGIVGGLILGQAAVSANLVSPILIIIVSVAGLGAFAIPSVSLSRAVSALRFVFIILGGMAGFLGLAAGVLVSLSALAGRTSFGVPYLSPLTPRSKNGFIKTLLIAPLWKREHRPDALKTEKVRKQPAVSRKWKKGA